MVCKTCGQGVPDGKLACPYCSERRGYEGALAAQRVYLKTAVGNRLEFRLARRAVAGSFHVQLFGVDRQAYCGAALEFRNRTRSPFSQIPFIDLCKKCREVLDRLIAEAGATDTGAGATAGKDAPAGGGGAS